MFEYEGMQTAAALRSPDERGDRGRGDREHIGRNGAARASDHVGAARAALDRITALRSRVADMEATRVDTEGLPTADALAPLLPGGAIRAGGTYSVPESVLLAQTMLQAASAAGSWCAVVGVPSFGVEAAAAAGIDLERLVLVPDPGDQWLAVTAALADVAQIVLTRPLGRVVPGDVARLSARLRQRGAALVALGSWPGADVTLRVTESHWSGIGQGHGYLTERRVTVTASGRAGAVRPTSTELLLPAADGAVRAAVPVAASAGGRVLRPVAVAS
ncbi:MULTISPECIES: hypothetical protein [unclassified Curtobacterium]|uniref:hypothetical protein n=1 Tax=unclassified Curtobacterium TaxID=257496 RepID=UPI0021ACEB2A|nr:MULTISPECIES: hypothetical protein [unclassified Curtobacterium]WIB12184.1 hypothetical protein DEJ36_15750 [Curtobacterium sp. MCPF17_052]